MFIRLEMGKPGFTIDVDRTGLVGLHPTGNYNEDTELVTAITGVLSFLVTSAIVHNDPKAAETAKFWFDVIFAKVNSLPCKKSDTHTSRSDFDEVVKVPMDAFLAYVDSGKFEKRFKSMWKMFYEQDEPENEYDETPDEDDAENESQDDIPDEFKPFLGTLNL